MNLPAARTGDLNVISHRKSAYELFKTAVPLTDSAARETYKDRERADD